MHGLTLDALVAGALILYPAYVSQVTGYFTTPERALDELLDWRASGPTNSLLRRRALFWLYRAFKVSCRPDSAEF
jgi:capsular polysaccharide export protein